MEVIRRQFHGRRQESEDSYVTTEFVALWFLPLWPVASYKVVTKEHAGRGGGSGGKVDSTEIPIQWVQAIEGWLFLFALLGAVTFLIVFTYLAEKFDWRD